MQVQTQTQYIGSYFALKILKYIVVCWHMIEIEKRTVQVEFRLPFCTWWFPVALAFCTRRIGRVRGMNRGPRQQQRKRKWAGRMAMLYESCRGGWEGGGKQETTWSGNTWIDVQNGVGGKIWRKQFLSFLNTTRCCWLYHTCLLVERKEENRIVVLTGMKIYLEYGVVILSVST